ncbi:lipid A deacylase LpxR family protein [Shewanella sp. 1CM18E]|uniref:lipid A deacylase LpxR family protein n=1 Tax=Shewanella sp. 1CM18E TaxID=2929169 RepID=UPI0020BF356D|nr:lipid A deacylase LpxR family protein [Shewanella sp. 1CM18E]MCK8043445.1 lipid A deacylase LpxR family protein [Shewanella sp. 1CM18E]
MTFLSSRSALKPFSVLAALLCIPTQSFASQWYLSFDNDVVIGQDGDYSNGVALGWQPVPQADFSDATWLFNWQKMLTLPIATGEQTSQWGAKVYQRMWTPIAIEADQPQPYDRPYAGLLELESFTGHFSDTLAQKNWFSIGVIGPASGAQAMQELVHKITPSTSPNGWEYQVENQFTAQFAYEIDTLLNRWQSGSNQQWEISGHSYSAIGNFRSETNLGMTLRWGDNLASSFGQLSNQPGHFGQYSANASKHGNWLVYARAQAGYRFNDLTIDGDLPYQSYVAINHLQAQASTGVIWAFPTWSVSWSFNLYTKEYQSDPDSWHGYGVLNYSMML